MKIKYRIERGWNMGISLKDINESNWIECIFLTTNKENKPYILEEFVASNAVSIAQSKIENGWITKAIYNENEVMIGFTMYGYSEKNQFFEICRIMIDHRYQRQGHGKQAMIKIIEEMNKFEDCDKIYLSFDSNNPAKKLYEALGFEDTGRIIDNELLYCLEIKK